MARSESRCMRVVPRLDVTGSVIPPMPPAPRLVLTARAGSLCSPARPAAQAIAVRR